MKTTAVIMAGGKGERFWPKSRGYFPKQFLSLTGDGKTMLQLTAERLRPMVDYEDMFVVTNQNYVGLVREQLPEIPDENILAEPMAKNTAPCIGFAAAVISRKYRDAVMLVLPSDHLVKLEDAYTDTLSLAAKVASESESLVTIGITPTYPETGYGYIELSPGEGTSRHRGVYAVNRFVEKPDVDTAKEYLASGNYLWNSGMFVWKQSTIMKKFRELLPDIYSGIIKIGEAFGTAEYERVLADCFSGFKSKSIDYGIMERTSGIYAIPGSFGWDDVGSWLALERINAADEYGNIIQGDAVTIDTAGSIISGGDKLIATMGIRDMVIVDSGDAILICAKDRTSDLKRVIESLKDRNRGELL